MQSDKIVRSLRVAWSVWWGIVCFLFVVLWVRSYWWEDSCSVSFDGRRAYGVWSIAGELRYSTPGTFQPYGPSWNTYVEPVNEILQRERRPPSIWSAFGFGVFKSPTGPPSITSRNSRTTITVPHWFPVMILAVLSAAPWFPWKFSLRTLLIAITLIAVVLGLVVIMWR